MKSMTRWVALGALFLIPFLPLYVANDMFFPFISSKGFWFRILIEIAAGALVFLALADKKYRPKWSWTLVVYGALVAWMFVANLFAVNPLKAFWSNYERMDGWVTLAHVFLFFVVAGTILSAEKLWKRWWLTALGASALIAGYSVLQLMGSLEIHQGGVRVDASFGNAAYLAAYLLFMIAVGLWQALESKGWLRYALFALTAVHGIVLFATATRGAILGLVAAAGLGAVLYMFLSGKKGRVMGAGILTGLVLITGLFLLVRESSFVQSDPTLSRIASITLADGEVRFTLWDMALKGASERPLVGWGQEGYAYIFTKFYDPSLYAQEPWFDRAHSVYMDWLVAGGIPSFLLFIALLGTAAFALLRSNATKNERVFLIAALGAYAFQALFVFDNVFTYIFLAAVLAAAHEVTARPIQKLEALPELSKNASASIAAPAIGVITAAIVWVVNVPGITGSTELIRAVSNSNPATALTHFRSALSSGTFGVQEVREQLMTYAANVANRQDVPLESRTALMALALTEAKKQVDAVPEDMRFRLQYVQALEAAGNIEEALSHMETALEYSPNKQGAILQYGIMLLRQERRAEAYALFQRAYELDTTNDNGAVYAATGAIMSGAPAAGKALLEAHFGTSTIDHDLIRFAYYDRKMFTELLASTRLKRDTNPDEQLAVFLYTQALALAGRPAEARAELAAAVAKHPQWSADAAQLSLELGI